MKAPNYGEVSIKLIPSRGNLYVSGSVLCIFIRTRGINSNRAVFTMNYLYNTYYKSEHRVSLILR